MQVGAYRGPLSPTTPREWTALGIVLGAVLLAGLARFWAWARYERSEGVPDAQLEIHALRRRLDCVELHLGMDSHGENCAVCHLHWGHP
jgi:hypothetical protein